MTALFKSDMLKLLQNIKWSLFIYNSINKYSTCRVRLATQDISWFSVPMQFTFHCHNWVSGGSGKGYPSISGDVYIVVLQ